MRSQSQHVNVLLVSPVGEIGGAEKVFLSLAKHLQDSQIKIYIACMRPGPLVQAANEIGIEAFEFKPHRYRQLKYVWQGIQWLSGLVRDLNIDIIHANHTSHLYAFFASQITGKPEVWHLHDFPYTWDWVYRLLVHLPPAHVIFTTKKVQSGFIQLQHRPQSVIPPICIDTASLCSWPEQPDIRKTYNLPSGPLLLTVGRLQEHKGHRYLLKAIPIVLKVFPNAIFAVVGKPGNLEQEAYQNELLGIAKTKKIEDHIKFLGHVQESELVALYKEASALVHPATSEGFGLVLLEAITLGTPVIAAAADGPSEIICDDHNGMLVPIGDHKILAKKIIDLLSSDELAKRLSQNAMKMANKYRPGNMVKANKKVYIEISKSIQND